MIDPVADVGFEGLYGLVDAAADLLVGEVAEPALDLVDPGGPGRGEVDVEAGVVCEPVLDYRGLVGAVVVLDQVDVVKAGGDVLVDPLEELQELLMVLAAVPACADHGAGFDVEGGEQAGDAVPGVVVSAPLGHAGHHREHRLGPVQGLDLVLLVHAQDHGLIRRVVVEADDVDDLLHEQRVGAHLEPVDQVRLEAGLAPDPPDRGLRQAAAAGHRGPRPVRRARGSSSRVAVTTSSTLSSKIDSGRPGRFSSCRPSSRCRTNRPRQRATLCSLVRSSAATALFSLPSAQASTIFARSARTWEVFVFRAHRCSCSRSAPVETSPALRLPGRGLSDSPPGPSLVNRPCHCRYRLNGNPQVSRHPGIPVARLPPPRQDDPRAIHQAEVPGPGQPAEAPHDPHQTAPAAQPEATWQQHTD